MLTRKTPLLLGGSLGLIAVGLGFQLFAAVVLGVALLALFAVNALFVLPPKVEAEITTDRDRITEETEIRVAIHLRNLRRRPEIFEQYPELPPTFIPVDASTTGTVALGAREAGTWIVPVTPRLFGVHHVGPLRVRTMDPSALRATEYILAEPTRLLVHPRSEPMKTVPLTRSKQTNFLGINEVQQPGDGFEFFTLRKFQPGDSVRSVNWRASARSTDIIVNQRQRESYFTAHILFDARESAHVGRAIVSPFATGARAAAALAEFLMRRQDRVFFHIVTDEIETIHPQTPERQRITLLDTLATTRPHGGLTWREVNDHLLPRMRSHSPVILASSFETDPTVIDVVHELFALEHPVLALSGPSHWGADREDPRMAKIRALHRELVKREVTAGGGHFVDLAPGRPLTVSMQEAML